MRKIVRILSMGFMEFPPVKEHLCPHIETAEPQVAILISTTDFDVRDASEAVNKSEKVRPGDCFGDEMMLLGDAKVGFVAHEIVPCSEVSEAGAFKTLGVFWRDPTRIYPTETPDPYRMRQQIQRKRFDENATVDPHEMQFRIFCDHDIATTDNLMVKRRDMRMRRGCDQP